MYLTGLSDLTEHQRGQLRRIYESAFPPDERQPFEDLLERADDDNAVSLVHLVESEVVACALLTLLPERRCFFFEYLMVDESYRNAGLGGRLYRRLETELVARGGPPRMVLEVEHPDYAADAMAATLRRRRMEFYLRNGAVRLPVDDYAMPNLQGDGVVRMCLLWQGEGKPSSGAELDSLIESIYRDGYGLPVDHPLRNRRGTVRPPYRSGDA